MAQVRTAEIVLHVTRIEVIRDVENDGTRARLLVQERQSEAFQDRSVQRHEGGKTRAIATSDEIQPIVHERKREA